MASTQLDDVDRGKLRSRQEDARSATADEKDEKVGVFRGDPPEIDSERANFQRHTLAVSRLDAETDVPAAD